MSCKAADFRAAMRGLASGVSLVTTLDQEGSPHGMAATAVMSVSAEPPRILICVNKTASMQGPLALSGRFAVNFLSATQADLVQLFSTPQNRHLRFAEGGWSALQTGAPVLEGAVAVLDCTVVDKIDAASHVMFIGAVVATRAAQTSMPPLVYCHGGLGAFAAKA